MADYSKSQIGNCNNTVAGREGTMSGCSTEPKNPSNELPNTGQRTAIDPCSEGGAGRYEKK